MSDHPRCKHCGQLHPADLRYCPQNGKLIAPERFFPQGMLLEGKYRLGELLGEGGMSLVFEASHLLLGKKVAIKLLLPQLSQDQEMTERMMREARIASSSGHRNVVAVNDVGRTEEGAIYLVMEYLAGLSLDELIEREAPLAVSRAARLTMQILAGLEAVHRQGVVHRDLKPSNVIVTCDSDVVEEIKILDFGISKRSDEEGVSELTTIGKVLGTPLFMAPEQARGERQLDQRVDIYACGAILYALLTGAPPIQAPNLNALIARILEANIDPPSSRIATIPTELDAVVLRALARESAARFAGASEFRQALQPFTELSAAAPARPAASKAGEATLALTEQSSGAEQPGPSGGARLPYAETIGSLPEVRLAGGEAELGGGLSGAAADPSLCAASPEPPLELARGPRVAQPLSTGTLYARPSAWRRRLWLLIVLVLLVGGGGLAWQQRDRLAQLMARLGGQASVLLLVQPEPRDADVYVDGVLQVTQPVALPQTAQTYKVRVEAPGYLPRVLRVDGRQSRTLQVVLRRQH